MHISKESRAAQTIRWRRSRLLRLAALVPFTSRRTSIRNLTTRRARRARRLRRDRQTSCPSRKFSVVKGRSNPYRHLRAARASRPRGSFRPCTHKSRLVSSGRSMSALPPEADIRPCGLHVRLVPIADVASAHHLGACGQCTSTPSRSADRSHDASLHVVLSLALEGEDFWSGRATPAGASSPPRPSSAAMAFLSVARMRSRAVASTALGSR